MRHDIIDIFLTTMLCYRMSTDTWYHYLGGTYMFNHRRAYPLLTISFIVLFLLSACGSNSPQSGSSSNGSSSSTVINVVAAENFYGDIRNNWVALMLPSRAFSQTPMLIPTSMSPMYRLRKQ